MKSTTKRGGIAARYEAIFGYLFVSPMVIGYALFLLGPIVAVFAMSFTDWSLIKASQFIGMDNYKKLLIDDVFWETVWNTFYFTAVLVPLNIIVTLGLALLLKERIPGVGLFRTAFFTPVVTSLVAWAVVWKYIFQTDNGLVNSLLKLFDVTGPAWLHDMTLTMPVIIFVTLMKGFGINMVIFLAALNDVPEMYYEAAKLDGASRWRSFWHVTLPLISPSMFMVVILTIIGSLKVFGQIYIITGGGPGTSTYVFIYYIYSLAFKEYQFGYATTIAFIVFVVIMLITIVQWNARKRWVHYES